MNMFQTLLNSIPKHRSEVVEDLEIPEITLSPYLWEEPEEILSERSESFVTDSMGLGECDRGTISTDSSIPMSRAMTDSEIDYGLYKRFKRCNYSDPWDHMRAAMDAFPPDYLASLSRPWKPIWPASYLDHEDRLYEYRSPYYGHYWYNYWY